MKTLETWGGQSTFRYEGSVKTGTRIYYGTKLETPISADQYAQLLEEFGGQTVDMGQSRGDTPEGSLGAWLVINVVKRSIATYVGAVLAAEGYAEKVPGDPSAIRFK